MVRHVDFKERKEDILDLVVESYIETTKPIGSSYLCSKHKLPYSSATVRNVLEDLEKEGFLSHLHTSSGRVPTKKGFKRYVERLKKKEVIDSHPMDLSQYHPPHDHVESAANYTLDALAQISGYTSMLVLSSPHEERIFFRGTRYMLEQPEFENIQRVRNLLYALEVQIDQLQHLLASSYDEQVRILIGDELGFDQICDCSLVLSGAHERGTNLTIGVLGPMRMDYERAIAAIYSMRNQMHRTFEGIV